jgi:hypothetical protein
MRDNVQSIKAIIKLPPNIGVYIIKRVGWISTRLPTFAKNDKTSSYYFLFKK